MESGKRGGSAVYIVQQNNKTIAMVSDLESAMAVFDAKKYPYTWLRVIDTATDKTVAYWIY